MLGYLDRGKRVKSRKSGLLSAKNTMAMHQIYFVQVIAPNFMAEEEALRLPPSQKTIWQIDVWSVHRSEQFHTWMKEHHTSIILQFMLGGCTAILQPCDVGIQRIFKHSLKRSYHEDVVKIMTAQIESGAEELIFDK
jgi:hypothetical protein